MSCGSSDLISKSQIDSFWRKRNCGRVICAEGKTLTPLSALSATESKSVWQNYKSTSAINYINSGHNQCCKSGVKKEIFWSV